MYIKAGIFVEFIDTGINFIVNDYFNGKQYLVDEVSKINLLRDSFSHKTYQDICALYGESGIQFIDQMINLKVIMFTNEKETYKDIIGTGGVLAKFYSSNTKVFPIEKLSFEVPSMCANNCEFCSKDSLFNCQSCYMLDTSIKLVDLSNLKLLLEKVFSLNLTEITFTGADPLNNTNYINKIIETLNELGYKNKIYINSSLSSPSMEKIEILKDERVQLNYQVINTHYSTLSNIENLHKMGISLVVIIRHSHFVEITKYCESIDIPYILNCEASSYLNKINTLADYTNLIGLPRFNSRVNCRGSIKCLLGSLHITSNGLISVCKCYDSFSDIGTNSINEILNSAAVEWCDFKKEREQCISCSVRYLCHSCSYINKNVPEIECKLSKALVF